MKTNEQKRVSKGNRRNNINCTNNNDNSNVNINSSNSNCCSKQWVIWSCKRRNKTIYR